MGRPGDGDGYCADIDNCPAFANASQIDTDGDGVGDGCELDDDDDGVQDIDDPCPLDNPDDSNEDGFCDSATIIPTLCPGIAAIFAALLLAAGVAILLRRRRLD